MNPLVFAQENVVLIDLAIETVKHTKVMDDDVRYELNEDLRSVTENTRVIIDILKKRNKKETP